MPRPASGRAVRIALGIYVAVASVGIAVPAIIYVVLGTDARAVLEDMKSWMIRTMPRS